MERTVVAQRYVPCHWSTSVAYPVMGRFAISQRCVPLCPFPKRRIRRKAQRTWEPVRLTTTLNIFTLNTCFSDSRITALRTRLSSLYQSTQDAFLHLASPFNASCLHRNGLGPSAKSSDPTVDPRYRLPDCHHQGPPTIFE